MKNFDREITNPNVYFTIEDETLKAVKLEIFKPEYPNYPSFEKWIPKSVIENLDWVLSDDDEEDVKVKAAKYNDRIATTINIIAMREAKTAEARFGRESPVFTPEYYGGEWPEEVEKRYQAIKRGENAKENAWKIQQIFESLATSYAKEKFRKKYEQMLREKGIKVN